MADFKQITTMQFPVEGKEAAPFKEIIPIHFSVEIGLCLQSTLWSFHRLGKNLRDSCSCEALETLGWGFCGWDIVDGQAEGLRDRIVRAQYHGSKRRLERNGIIHSSIFSLLDALLASLRQTPELLNPPERLQLADYQPKLLSISTVFSNSISFSSISVALSFSSSL